MNSYGNQRRIFRGRGGPTDGRLPKQNARRRSNRSATKPAANKYEEADKNDAGDVEGRTSMDESLEEEDATMVPSETLDESEDVECEETISETMTNETSPPKVSACQKEVKHLVTRVKNIREALQLSTAISNPKTYQDNVLNAVANCVNEWRSIVRHYPQPPSEASMEEDLLEDTDYMMPEIKKPAALAVFEMIQHAIQCGPLAGGKPGYFKRCGGDVAKVVLTFLDEVVPNQILGDLMGLSSKQMDVMEKWRKAAATAAAEDKPPSRTAQKHQQGKGTGKKAKKKMKGK